MDGWISYQRELGFKVLRPQDKVVANADDDGQSGADLEYAHLAHASKVEYRIAPVGQTMLEYLVVALTLHLVLEHFVYCNNLMKMNDGQLTIIKPGYK